MESLFGYIYVHISESKINPEILSDMLAHIIIIYSGTHVTSGAVTLQADDNINTDIKIIQYRLHPTEFFMEITNTYLKPTAAYKYITNINLPVVINISSKFFNNIYSALLCTQIIKSNFNYQIDGVPIKYYNPVVGESIPNISDKNTRYRLFLIMADGIIFIENKYKELSRNPYRDIVVFLMLQYKVKPTHSAFIAMDYLSTDSMYIGLQNICQTIYQDIFKTHDIANIKTQLIAKLMPGFRTFESAFEEALTVLTHVDI